MHVPPLDIGALRILTPREQAHTFLEVVSTFSSEDITESLLRVVESGSITPTIFARWLPVSCSPSTLRRALQQDVSIEVRRCGIIFLRKALDSTQWRDTWDGLGGTAGVLELMAELSVHEVRATCVTIGKSSRKREVEEKKDTFTPLLEATLPRFFPKPAHVTKDERPLQEVYQRLAPSCTSRIVTKILTGSVSGDWTTVRLKDFAQLQSDTLKDLIVQSIIAGQRIPTWLSSFFWQGVSEKRSLQTYSIDFSLEVLRMVIDQTPPRTWSCSMLGGLIDRLTRRCINKRRTGDLADELIELTLRFLDKRHEAAEKLGSIPKNFLHLIALRWCRHPVMIEHNFKKVLLHFKEFWRSPVISDLFGFISGVPRSQRYELLRFCYYTISQKDIAVEADLAEAKLILYHPASFST